MLPSLPEIDSTIEIVAVSATGALLVSGVITFIASMIRALKEVGSPNQSRPSADLRDRF